MKFKKHKISIAIACILVSLIGLAIIQIHWLNKTIATNRQIFVQNMDKSAKEAGELYRNDADLAGIIHNLILSDININKIDKHITPIIDDALQSNNLPLNYEYGIYKHKGSAYNQLIYGTTEFDVLKNSECNKKEEKAFGWGSLTCNLGYPNGNAYHLAIFPSYKSFIINEVKYSLFAFITFLSFILLGFYFLLKTINQQKKISDIKNDFINNLTHEFKTPIFSMSLASKALRKSLKEGVKVDSVSYIDVIDNESERLKNQVDKILQLSLLDSAKFQLNKAKVDIHKQLKSVIENFKLILREKNGSINFKLNAQDYSIQVDELHLKNVWYNILDNAIKYCDKKPVITIETFNKNGLLVVTINDTGIGMSLDKQKMIFDRFYRVPTGNIYTTKGFGIGLSYTKSIIDLHDGKIEVKSKQGIGSTFKIELPLNDN